MLTKHFTTEKGRQISLDEVKTFALDIPHVSWKVERIRRLSSAMSMEDSSSSISGSAGSQVRFDFIHFKPV